MAKKKRTTHDATFGDLVHLAGDGWTRPLQMKIFARDWESSLTVDLDPEDGIEENQRLAFAFFVKNVAKIAAVSEKAIFKYYQSVCGDYRGRHGIKTANDRRMPLVKSIADMFRLVELESVVFPYVRPRPTFGILCQCTWEEEHGLAVRFEDGKVAEVGFQDIVL